MSKVWRYLNTGKGRGGMNMATDEAIMIALSRGLVSPTLRIYGWSPPAISIGYSQRFSEEINKEACHEHNVQLVRRATGGRAVLHQYEVTYSIIFKEGEESLKGGIMATYKKLSQGILRGLEILGVEAHMVTPKIKKGSLRGACFDAPSWYEIAVDGRKLVGSAQVRRGGFVLQHGSILLDHDVDLLFSLLKSQKGFWGDEDKESFARKIVTLKELMDTEPSFDALGRALRQGISQILYCQMEDGELSQIEVELAEEITANKYDTDEWLRRC